jgi:hypothetical protein
VAKHRRIEIAVDLAADLKACIGRRQTDQLHNHLMADQRLSTPAHGNGGEQPEGSRRLLTGGGFFSPSLDGDLPLFSPSHRAQPGCW